MDEGAGTEDVDARWEVKAPLCHNMAKARMDERVGLSGNQRR